MTISLILVAIACCVMGFVFAAADTAISRVSVGAAEEWYREGRRGASQLRTILSDAPGYLSVMTFVRVASEATAAVCITVAASTLLPGPWLVPGAVGVLAVFMFVFFGVSPRTLGRQHAAPVSCAVAPLVVWLRRILGPFARLLVAVANALTPGKGYTDGPFESEAELRHLLDEASDSLVIEDEEREMIHSVFDLGDTLTREIMVPRTDMQAIESTATLRSAMSAYVRSGFSRLPVLGDDADDPVGLLYFKDVARRLHYAPASAEELVTTVMRPVPFVPESKNVDELLREMQMNHTHLAVVVDEYGGTAGLVTIEDILEEIVGEISDEHDREAPGVEILDARTARLPASMPVDDLAELFDVSIHSEDVDTVGGLVAQLSGQVPSLATKVTVEGVELSAVRMDSRRQRLATVLARASRPVLQVPHPVTSGHHPHARQADGWGDTHSGKDLDVASAPASHHTSEGGRS